MTVELALDLAEIGYKVFPVNHTEANEKKPYTTHGHLDASSDPGIIMDWWEKWPNAKVGVPAGVNGIVGLDVDTKNGKDGFDSIDQNYLEIPQTFAYDTGTGGRHFIYAAPEGVKLNGQSDYRGMAGVDRRGGESWLMWVGPAPDEDITDAPKWLCDPAEDKRIFNFEGDLEDWFQGLVPGEPNALVRRAIQKIDPDMSHSEMVEAQHAAIRLGAEGNSGVPQLLEALQEAWENRPAENHTTPEGEWTFKFEEALQSGLEKYGDLTDLVKNLPSYDVNMVPASIPDGLVTTENTGKEGFSRLLGALVKETDDDNRILSILWNCASTREISRDWGLQFTARRIKEARVRPEPTRENPRIEEQREREIKVGASDSPYSLLTDKERQFLESRPTFVNHVVDTAEGMSYDQTPYFRSGAWVTAAMAFSFKGFIPLSPTHKMGLNLWMINPGDSGTGKSVTGNFIHSILREVFAGDDEDVVPYDLGDDSSPQGLHTALVERDHRPSMFSSDEAAGFFASLGLKDWKTSVEEKLTSWYNGWVQGSNKLSQKELRGKSAMTSLNMYMFGTPDKLSKVILAEMFETGFMARVCWSFGLPPRNDSSRFQIKIDTSNAKVEFEGTPKALQDHAMDLIMAGVDIEQAVAMKPGAGSMERLSEAYERMYRLSEGRENWHLVEPSLTRLAESMQKMAAISAMYRGDSVIQIDDSLRAIWAMEEYFANLHRMVGLVSAGQFQQRAEEIEQWIRGKGGVASRAAIFHRFKNFIERDSREVENLLTFLVESGAINRDESGGAMKYQVNGGD